MMYRLMIKFNRAVPFSNFKHKCFERDEDAISAAKACLDIYPRAAEVVIYRFFGYDTCGPMSYVTTIER